MNDVGLVGRLTKAPEVRYTANNQTPVAKFTIAVNRLFKQEGQPDADFIPIVVWGKQAENCGQYLDKGRLVAIKGRIQTRSWDDQEGKRHSATEVTADEVHFLDKGNDKEKGSKDKNSTQNNTGGGGEFEEDNLPF